MFSIPYCDQLEGTGFKHPLSAWIALLLSGRVAERCRTIHKKITDLAAGGFKDLGDHAGTHRIHGAGIYANIGGILMVNVTYIWHTWILWWGMMVPICSNRLSCFWAVSCCLEGIKRMCHCATVGQSVVYSIWMYMVYNILPRHGNPVNPQKKMAIAHPPFWTNGESSVYHLTNLTTRQVSIRVPPGTVLGPCSPVAERLPAPGNRHNRVAITPRMRRWAHEAKHATMKHRCAMVWMIQLFDMV